MGPVSDILSWLSVVVVWLTCKGWKVGLCQAITNQASLNPTTGKICVYIQFFYILFQLISSGFWIVSCDNVNRAWICRQFWLIGSFKMQSKVVLVCIHTFILPLLFFFRHFADLDAFHCYKGPCYQSFTLWSHLLSSNFQICNISIYFLFIDFEENDDVIKRTYEERWFFYAML